MGFENSKDKDFKQYFTRVCGPVIQIHQPEGKNYVLVWFKNREGAENAIMLKDQILKEKKWVVLTD